MYDTVAHLPFMCFTAPRVWLKTVFPPHLPTRRQAARDGVSQERRKNMGEMAGEARFSREMAAARGLIGDPAQARRDSPDPGRRHDGRGHILLPSSAPRGPRGC